MFNSILENTLTIKSFTVCILVALILGAIMSILHMKTTKSNKNFLTTLFILPALVTSVILLVNGNLGTSVAVAGAFSLVRFRSIPGNSREILAVFFAMAIGLALGTGYIGFAVAFTLIISLALIMHNSINLNEGNKEKILKINIPEDLDYTNCFDDLFKEFTNYCELRQSKTVNMGSIFELTYIVNLKKQINEKEFIDSIRVRNGNLKITLTHPLSEEAL